MVPSRTAPRPTWWREGRHSGKFAPGKVLLDATSGNTGIAFAMIGAAEGFPVTLCMPENVSIERKHILGAYGANIVYTDPADGSDGAIRKAREIYAQASGKIFLRRPILQHANWQAHYHGTANEIWQQTEGRITHFVAMLGTSGTFVGTSRRLKELNPKIRCISSSAGFPIPRHRGRETYGQCARAQNLRSHHCRRRYRHFDGRVLRHVQTAGA